MGGVWGWGSIKSSWQSPLFLSPWHGCTGRQRLVFLAEINHNNNHIKTRLAIGVQFSGSWWFMCTHAWHKVVCYSLHAYVCTHACKLFTTVYMCTHAWWWYTVYVCVCYMTIWFSGFLYIGVHSCMIYSVCMWLSACCAVSALCVLVSLPTILIFWLNSWC